MRAGHQALTDAFIRAELRVRTTELSPNSLAVDRITSEPLTFAAATTGLDWALALETKPGRHQPATIALQSLRVEYGGVYQLDDGSGEVSLRVSVVRCTSKDPTVREMFGSFCAALLEELPPEPTESDLARSVDAWVALFWELEEPGRANVVGLAGELTVLDQARRPSQWLRAWHVSPFDNVDFAFPSDQLSVEVKATTSQTRVHDISISQSTHPPTDHRYFASVIVDLRDSGITLGELVRNISDRLDAASDAVLLWRILTKTCGKQLDAVLRCRIAHDTTRASLEFYRSESVPVPVVELPLPVGVAQLRFKSDFSSSTPEDRDEILGAVHFVG